MSILLANTSFYFIRHGQSQANADGVPAGTMDTPLTEQGRAEATSLRPIVENLPVAPAVIVTSTLQRAKLTASIINENLQLPTDIEPLLGEQHYGDCQGVPKDILIEKYGPDWSRNPPNGECFDDFTDRMIHALERILPGRAGIPLIVGHGGMAHALGRRYGINLRGLKNCTFLHFTAHSAESWSVADHEGAPYETQVTNMTHE
jgi:broad specificity phosphatase PhoE